MPRLRGLAPLQHIQRLLSRVALLCLETATMRTLCFIIVLLCLRSARAQITPSAAHERRLVISLFGALPIHPVDAFDLYIACVDTSLPDCDDTNVLKFVAASAVTTPQPNEFVYHDTGTVSTMQGAFWFQDQPIGNSILASFAITRGVSQGERNADGSPAYTTRPRGDHNWAFSGTGGLGPGTSSWLNEQIDVVYKFNRIEGTENNPIRYDIVAEGNLFWKCLRITFAQWFFAAVFQFTMDLNSDPSHPDVQQYTGSAIWQRRTSFFFGLYQPPGSEYNYNAIQIVDGQGTPIEPAYSEFIAKVKNDYDNRLYFYGIKPDRVGDYEDSCWF